MLSQIKPEFGYASLLNVHAAYLRHEFLTHTEYTDPRPPSPVLSLQCRLSNREAKVINYPLGAYIYSTHLDTQEMLQACSGLHYIHGNEELQTS